MQQISTDVLVIGGGATGTGVLRDLAMRGFKCILIERRDLAYGTTGRYHGLLHSGSRYVVKDPQAAKECYEENLVLRRIMPQCIEDTGGFFVSTPSDPVDYIPSFVQGCKSAGIQAEELPISSMLKAEPLLNTKIFHCVRVPDASADSFLAARLNVESARMHGAQALTYHEFVHLLTTDHMPFGGKKVTGAVCHDLVGDEDIQITASVVVNACGAWAGKVTQSAGIGLEMVPGKGTMLAINHRIVNTVISRCKPPGDGDILVPSHTVAVMGTTDIRVADPDHYSIEPWEIRMMLEEGEKIIPGFKELRILRAWAGVRPLVKTSETTNNRDISRGFILLDHGERDGIEGIVTITGGKWTTYRKMAQVTVDKVCDKLNTSRPCRTHLEPLPEAEGNKTAYYQTGYRLEKVEREAEYGNLLCECEIVSTSEVEKAIVQSDSTTLDDIRRETRLGMGPCQGAFCSFRAVGMLQTLRKPPINEINNTLRDFLDERWKGDQPILAGKQLQQARFNEFIYVDVLNAPSLPGKATGKLATEPYQKPIINPLRRSRRAARLEPMHTSTNLSVKRDVIVIGTGFAGLFAAYNVADSRKSVSVIAKGWGTPYWASGCIDVFGYRPSLFRNRIGDPHTFLKEFIIRKPNHPYAKAGIPALEAAIELFLILSQQSGYPFYGSLDENIMLPTALGTLRPSCLVPATMVAGNANVKTPMLVIGFDRFPDFYPAVVSENLNAQGFLTNYLSLDLPSLRDRKFVTGMVLARLFDSEEFCQEVIEAIKSQPIVSKRIGFPAILGVNHPMQVMEQLQTALGADIFEIPGLPPSIPGIRLQNMLVSALQRKNGNQFNGTQVIAASAEGKKVTSVWSEAAARQKEHQANTYILATGGILGGGITVNNDGYAQETVFNLPLTRPRYDQPRLNDRFLGHPGNPIFRKGVHVDSQFQPCTSRNELIYTNLYAIGDALPNCDPVRERSLEGIALATGFRTAEIIAEGGNK